MKVFLWIMPLLLSLVSSMAQGLTPADFGHGYLKVNQRELLGHRPLVVIVVQFTNLPLAHSVAYFDDYFFNFFPTNVSVNAAFREMSNNRFFWSRGAIVGLTNLPRSQQYFNYTNLTDGDLLFNSNIISQALSRRLFDLAFYDGDGNGRVTQDELQIIIVKNEAVSNGANRYAGTVPDPYSTNVWTGSISLFEHQTEFATIVHEAFHAAGTPYDLYYGTTEGNNRNPLLTVMAGTRFPPESLQIMHLDPWHKMQFGWSEPRIVSLRSNGVENIPAAQMVDPTAPIILYDPAMGTNEFFMLEYRTRTVRSRGPGYDPDVAGNGLVIWHIQQDNYIPLQIDGGLAVWGEGMPDLRRGNVVWGSNTTTPYLRWNNGCRTPARIHIRPFTIGDDRITVDIISDPETWVDFNFAGSPELGTVDRPYNTLAEGVANVAWAGHLRVMSGETPEAMPISKAMTIEACGGPVALGRIP